MENRVEISWSWDCSGHISDITREAAESVKQALDADPKSQQIAAMEFGAEARNNMEAATIDKAIYTAVKDELVRQELYSKVCFACHAF